MITLGVDAHKRVLAVVAVDERGRTLAHWQGGNTVTAWQEVLEWAGQWPERQWGIEGAGGYGRGLAQHLVGAGETVYEVNPRLTAEGRRRARRMDKNDRLDAQAVARVVVREAPELPEVVAEDTEAAVLDLLTRERDRLKAEADRLRNRLHQALFQLEPEYRRRFRSLSKGDVLAALAAYRPAEAGRVAAVRAAAVRRLAVLLRVVQEQVEEVTREIERLSKEAYPALLEVEGVGALTAGRLAGVLGTRRFRGPEALAAYGGAAPLETSSAGRVRHRLSRQGDRRLNSAWYLMALTQWAHGGSGRRYIERRMAEGKSWLEAVRALKWYLARAVWRVWQEHYAQRPVPQPA